MSRHREPLPSFLLYHLLKWSVVAPIFRLYFRGRFIGAERVPHRGAFIIVSNHASDFDPPLVSSTLGRPVSFMAKEELFQVPVLKHVIRWYGAYPVRRGTGDRSAIRSALSQLEQGWAVGIFLQGTRTPDGRIPDPKLGASLIAAKAQVPLLPVSIWGSDAIAQKSSVFPRPVAITIRVGELVTPPTSTNRAELQAITDQCTAQLHAMLDRGR